MVQGSLNHSYQSSLPSIAVGGSSCLDVGKFLLVGQHWYVYV